MKRILILYLVSVWFCIADAEIRFNPLNVERIEGVVGVTHDELRDAISSKNPAFSNAVNETVATKADKPVHSVEDNLAALTADGNLADSGKRVGELAIVTNPVPFILSINSSLIPYFSVQNEHAYKLFNIGPAGDFIFGGYNMVLSSGNASNIHYRAAGDDETDANEIAVKGDISATNQTFSDAVLAVNLDFTTNTTGAAYVAVTNALAGFGFDAEALAELPGGKVYGSIGALLAALAAAVAWLKKNKVQTLKLGDDSIKAAADGGVAKLDDFFTGSNSLLTGTIDAEVISKGTAPDAHLEAPTDEHLKLILADSSVVYDSAKALPYKLTSAIGDRVVATMTLTAASTDITLPTISANDTTVKDFILDVTNAYAVEGVATDACINIPRTDVKLVTRDGESLTDVTTVKAGKSAFICFTQKSPVVVDGTTYPCWCVIQLPFGDPS